MKSSIRAAVALGVLALAATQASASTVNLTSSSGPGSYDLVFDQLPGWMQVNVSGNVTGAVFKLADTINDGYTVDYQLYLADQTTTLDAAWQATDLGTQAINLAQAGVYRALSTGTYYLKMTFANGDATAFGASTEVSAVPLPAAAWLFGSALLGLGAMRRKQKAGANSEMALA